MYEEECEVSLLDNLFNSLFYLLNPFPQGEQLTSCSDDLAQLANTEFSNPMLIYFVLGDISLFLILLILITLYMTSSKFYMLAQHYKRYVLPLLLVFISEIVLVLYLITNIVSSRETFDIWTQMILLFFTLLFSLNHCTDRYRESRCSNHHRSFFIASRRIAIDKISESSRGVSCFSNRRAQRLITFEMEPPDNS